jgi:hypothetical protein
MERRKALDQPATTFTPGYSWRLNLDVKFGPKGQEERPDDWSLWQVRMHIFWGQEGFTLTNGSGITVENVSELTAGPYDIPVIRLTGAQTELLRHPQPIHYVIDIMAPDDVAKDYFAGQMTRAFGPPASLLA